MNITYEIQDNGECQNFLIAPACWGHCCTHSGYGNDSW